MKFFLLIIAQFENLTKSYFKYAYTILIKMVFNLKLILRSNFLGIFSQHYVKKITFKILKGINLRKYTKFNEWLSLFTLIYLK